MVAGQIRVPKIRIMLDDVGFGASSAFGGPCHTPTAERLAQGGRWRLYLSEVAPKLFR
jgi:hypothetical protein